MTFDPDKPIPGTNKNVFVFPARMTNAVYYPSIDPERTMYDSQFVFYDYKGVMDSFFDAVIDMLNSGSMRLSRESGHEYDGDLDKYFSGSNGYELLSSAPAELFKVTDRLLLIFKSWMECFSVDKSIIPPWSLFTDSIVDFDLKWKYINNQLIKEGFPIDRATIYKGFHPDLLSEHEAGNIELNLGTLEQDGTRRNGIFNSVSFFNVFFGGVWKRYGYGPHGRSENVWDEDKDGNDNKTVSTNLGGRSDFVGLYRPIQNAPSDLDGLAEYRMMIHPFAHFPPLNNIPEFFTKIFYDPSRHDDYIIPIIEMYGRNLGQRMLDVMRAKNTIIKYSDIVKQYGGVASVPGQMSNNYSLLVDWRYALGPNAPIIPYNYDIFFDISMSNRKTFGRFDNNMQYYGAAHGFTGLYDISKVFLGDRDSFIYSMLKNGVIPYKDGSNEVTFRGVNYCALHLAFPDTGKSVYQIIMSIVAKVVQAIIAYYTGGASTAVSEIGKAVFKQIFSKMVMMMFNDITKIASLNAESQLIVSASLACMLNKFATYDDKDAKAAQATRAAMDGLLDAGVEAFEAAMTYNQVNNMFLEFDTIVPARQQVTLELLAKAKYERFENAESKTMPNTGVNAKVLAISEREFEEIKNRSNKSKILDVSKELQDRFKKTSNPKSIITIASYGALAYVAYKLLSKK